MKVADGSKEYKIAVLGATGVGKSALTIQYTTQIFTEEYDPTLEDTYRKFAIVSDETCVLDILDTAGPEEYSFLKDDYLKTGLGYLIIYSITSLSSFHECSTLREQIQRVKDVFKVPLILVGNKCDLETARAVSSSEGEELARSFQCPFYECSAKENVNVENAFLQLVREIRSFYPSLLNSPSSSKKSKPTCSLL